jgi:Putative prokaryotic signal transducing protein
MTFEGDEPNLVAVFTGHRMEAELIRSLLESNDIPAAVFGEGAYAFGSDNVSTTERVMVRTDHLEAARAAIQEAGIVDEHGSAEIEQGTVTDDGFSFEDEEEEEDETGEGDELEVLAQGSDWGPRLVGFLGIAALVIAAIVILRAAT